MEPRNLLPSLMLFRRPTHNRCFIIGYATQVTLQLYAQCYRRTFLPPRLAGVPRA